MVDNIEERILTVAYENACKDPEYALLLSEAIAYGQKIMALLGPNKALFLKYQRSTCLAKEIRIKGAYQLGVEDEASMPNRMPNRI